MIVEIKVRPSSRKRGVEMRGAHPVFYLEAHISLFLVLFGLIFSFLIGCLSGFLPAKQASELEPVDALRYE